MDAKEPAVEAPQRLRIEIQGAVQGVGFRPYVYRLAQELGLGGWIVNDARGVLLEVEGKRAALDPFARRLPAELPPHAAIHRLEQAWIEPRGEDRFEIRQGDDDGARSAVVLPDLATCPDCLREALDPSDRRHLYPFTNCTNCGPRFTILEALPYDRPNTTMRRFEMCGSCSAEYGRPADRRFHAQPNACPACGPRLSLRDRGGATLAEGHAALLRAVAALREGRIVAVKGLGGFHLMADAADAAAIGRLRRAKPRREKPFALMARDLEQAATLCDLPPGTASLLRSAEAPIVLLPRRPDAPVAANVAPGVANLGLMLPYTPLHHLLLGEAGRPRVATSGNLSDEPICTDEHEALGRLGGIADLFLVHDRPIRRHADDSVVWFARGMPRLLRRARGYAPLPVRVRSELPAILAVGGHLKNTVALGVGGNVFLSQHIGDLETPEAMDAFERVIADFLRLYEAKPVAIAHDLHPDYLSTRWAREAAAGRIEACPGLSGARLVPVQHHHAHLAGCLAENGAEGEALGVSWDGTGYGPDATVWGGEFLLGDARAFRRVAHLRPFRLPGGEAAVREPRRVALALLRDTFGEDVLGRADLPPLADLGAEGRRLLGRLLERQVRAPVTTSAGRLFDGIASLAGVRQQASFEGQAAMELEFAADATVTDAYPLELRADGDAPLVLDWRPLVAAVVEDTGGGAPPGTVAARFMNALAGGIARVAREAGAPRVALSGGCFQNRWLVERAAELLADAGFEVLLHRQVPPNDGGLSLGQVAVAAAQGDAHAPRDR